MISASSSTPGCKVLGDLPFCARAVALSAGLKCLSFGFRCGVQRKKLSSEGKVSGRGLAAGLHHFPEQAVGACLRDPHRHDIPHPVAVALDLHSLKIGRLAGHLTRVTTRLLQENVQSLTNGSV